MYDHGMDWFYWNIAVSAWQDQKYNELCAELTPALQKEMDLEQHSTLS